MFRPQTFLLLIAALLLSRAAVSQTTAPPTQNPATPAAPPSSFVKLRVIVTDRNHRSVDDVRREEFRVSEDGVPQVITFFEQVIAPAFYGLVIDNSGSLRSRLNEMTAAGKYIVNHNQTGGLIGDEAFIVRFISSDKIEILQDFTTKTTRLNGALDGMYVEGGNSAVVDAVYESAKHLIEYKKNETGVRRSLILITDGEDRASFYKQEQLFELLRAADVQIFAIGLVQELRGKGRERAIGFLSSLSQETGGRAFFPAKKEEYQSALDEILHDLHTSYIIGYHPTNAARDNVFRKVQVSVNAQPNQESRNAIARAGYFVVPPATENKFTQKK